MLNMIRFTCTLATFLFAVLGIVMVVILGIRLMSAQGWELEGVLLSNTSAFVIVAWILASLAWLAAQALDRIAGDPEAIRGFATRLADATEKVADRTRKAASGDNNK